MFASKTQTINNKSQMKNKSIKVGSHQSEIHSADGNLIVLISYRTAVAAWVRGRGALCSTSFFSKSTSRHINRAVVRWQAPRVDVPQAEITALAVKIGYYGAGAVVFGD